VHAFLRVIRQSPDGFYEETDDDDFGSRITHPHSGTSSERTLVPS
jgi:hypothetical protein